MPADTSIIRNGYLLIKAPAKALYGIRAGDLTSITIKDEVLLEDMLLQGVTNRLKKLEEYSFNWIETPELWQSLTLTPEKKIMALMAIDDQLHCKIGLPNRNTIELTLDHDCSAESLAKIKEQPKIVLEEIRTKIKNAHLLFPIGLTPVEMRALNQSIGQFAEPAALPPLPNRMSFHAAGQRQGLPPPAAHRRSVQLPKRELTNTDVSSSVPKST